MADRSAPRGWFGLPPEAPELTPTEPPAPTPAESARPETPTPPAARARPAVAVRPVFVEPEPRLDKATQITLGLAVISGLIIVQAVLTILDSGQDVFSDAGDGALAAIRDCFAAGYVVLGICLFMRRELARRIYLVVAAIGYLVIINDAGSSGVGLTLLSLILQSIPVVFLLRRSVSERFS